MAREELLSTFGRFPNSRGSNFFHMKNKNNIYLKDFMQRIPSHPWHWGTGLVTDFYRTLLPSATWECAGRDSSQGLGDTMPYRALEPENALGTEFSFSLGN